ncbi:hypothetical protein DFH07DRAFT_789680 [Mycena maculata]|uniref:Uncharacterized protein n=1 Tax=Mycena maculata TaxID=230809 RepID=A0AAD7KG53_9AGAR|nr:hypothetical protein DFH07DRAFT_789680 [Mycena maculata]
MEEPEYTAALSYRLDQAHVRAESLFPTEWDFGELDPRDSKHAEILAYLEHLKSFWQPRLEIPGEWTHLILPPEPEAPDQSVDLDVWFPLSLISTILSSISSQIRSVPASEFINRATSPDYVGPQFPVRYPPGTPDFAIISAMNDLLLYEGPSTGALYYLAALFIETHGCQLKIHPDVRFPSRFGAKPPSIDFALVPEWKPTSESMLRRSRKAPPCYIAWPYEPGVDAISTCCSTTLGGAPGRATSSGASYCSRIVRPSCLYIWYRFPRYDCLSRRPHRISSPVILSLPVTCRRPNRIPSLCSR